MQRVRDVQQTILELYKVYASQYDKERKLKIRRVYDLIPSNLENKKKRVIFKQIEQKPWKEFNDYADEFEYLSASGIALEVKAISNPRFPLKESETKNLLKLYLNDVLSPLPIEVKSGKDYTSHSALNKFLGNSEYGISKAIVFSNEGNVVMKNGIAYMPVYYCMFLSHSGDDSGDMFPKLEELKL
ncbi:MAG: hypothetical protein MJZ34_12045 [Paludibacteraceae bacterium]|nr:hypothetical protein [Paludibacteraceae bacterium]